MDSYKTGLFSEFIACVYLILHGFRIVCRRYTTGKHTGRAEIDIIARRRNLIVFVEVKYRKTIDAAWGAISTAQQGRLRRAAETYLLTKRLNCDARFDVIIIHGFHINWIKNAF
ncbi:MAG: YraN family protein [Alphaproteobacteria bacterium]|nr:YraN family protein [Alphaproteobacteria bacterium]